MDALEERGLVTHDRGSDDRRSYEIRLSPEGWRLLKLRAEGRTHAERFLEPLTVAEHAELHRLLEKLAAGIDEQPC